MDTNTYFETIIRDLCLYNYLSRWPPSRLSHLSSYKIWISDKNIYCFCYFKNCLETVYSYDEHFKDFFNFPDQIIHSSVSQSVGLWVTFKTLIHVRRGEWLVLYKHFSAVFNKTKILLFWGGKLCCLVTSVTKWLDYFHNIWPLKTLKICPNG